MPVRYIPNFITCLRLFLVGPVLFALLNRHYLLALILFVLAGVTDALDGLLARLYGWTSRFGAVADPLADKLLLMSSFIALYSLGLIPVWLMAAIVGRDLWILVGVLSYRCLIGRLEVAPSGISKINTFLQILLVPLLLIDQSLFHIPYLLIQVFMLLVLMTSIASFLHYTWVWGLRALRSKKLVVTDSQHKKIGMQKGTV